MRGRLIFVMSVLLAVVAAVPASAAPPPEVSIAPPFTYYFIDTGHCTTTLGSPLPCAPEEGRDLSASGSYDGTGHVHSRLEPGTEEGYSLITYVAYHNISRSVEKIEYTFTIYADGRAVDDLVPDAEVRADVGWVDSAGTFQSAPTVTLIANGETFDGTRVLKATFEPVDALGRPIGIAAGQISVQLTVTAYANAAPYERSVAEADFAVTNVTYKARA